MAGGLYQTLSQGFATDPSTPFMTTLAGRCVTYGELDRLGARIAHRMATAGANPGDRVLVQTEKSPEAVVLYLACVRAGFVYVPLNPGYTAEEVAYFLADAEPRVVVGGRTSPLLAAQTSACGFSLEADGTGTLLAGPADASFAPPPLGSDDLAAILYTSGTTGRPKGAQMTQDNMASNAVALHRLWGFGPGDTLVHALPIFHTHGLFVAINTTLLNGTGMIFLARFDADEVIRCLPRATVLMGVPTFYVRLLAHPDFSPKACRTIRLFISGSAPLAAETFSAFEGRTGHRILERYGMTETGMITSNPLVGDRVRGSVGPPLPGVAVRVQDDRGSPLPTGDIGGIQVRGPNVFKGYWRNPEKTREEFTADGFFRTGDVGLIDERGYVHIVGRSKDLIISGGFNVYPKEVESVLDGIDGVQESTVIGVPHPDFGEAVVAVVIAKTGRQTTLDPDAITAAARAKLAAYKIPKAVKIVAEIPRNAMGKVEKARLRERYRNLFD
ncbi:MAG: malonyl-CoA synthase [Alphaproteobacteria bacterium]|nr:malonyl-CoA synthase [Alphaproteobacteria bacterium]